MDTLLALRCTCCGDRLRYDKENNKYVCDSCGMVFQIVNDAARQDDFKIVAGVLEKYTGKSPLVRIPEGVSIIGDDCFSGMELIESIELPTGIIKIGDNAFSGCMRLKYVSFPETLKSIGNGAFKESGLIEVEIPDSVTTIGKDAFMGCSTLRRVVLPYNPMTFERTFKLCDSLKNVECDLRFFCISFRSSNDAKKNGDPRSTLFDAFQATPYFYSLYSRQLKKECVICGAPIGKRGVCTVCGTKHVDLDRGCYIATAVYGSYDCPEVWTLRRFRDQKLARNPLGRVFIRVYYAVSPKVVDTFGKKKWFNRFWKNRLDMMARKLNGKGIGNTPYVDD